MQRSRHLVSVLLGVTLLCVGLGAVPAGAAASGVVDNSTRCASQNAEVEQAASGSHVYEAWMGCSGIAFASSTDGGASFGAPVVVPGSVGSTHNSWDPTVAVGANGKVYVSFMLGQSMLAPAVAVEGTDSVDAIQRIYAYLLGRPGRALIYLSLAAVQGLIAIGLAAWVLNGAADLTASMAGSFLPGERSRALFEPGQQSSAGGAIVAFWQLFVSLILSGVLVSWHATAGTLVYLLLRRVCDEQDLREVWMPGVIPGTRASETPAA